MVQQSRFLSRFIKSERGGMGLMFGLSLIPIMAVSGAVLDYSSASNTRSMAQSEVDAASLEIMRAAVSIHTNPANAAKSAAAKNAEIEAKAAAILSVRTSLIQSRAGSGVEAMPTLTATWADPLQTEFRVDASFLQNRVIPSLFSGEKTMLVTVSATAKMEVDTILQSSVPKIENPGFEAGDYNRIYAYCYNHANRLNADKGRSQMTAISSNGQDGTKMEMTMNVVFQSVTMPVCQSGETLSWRLYNLRGQRTTKSNWPVDAEVAGSNPKRWTQTDKLGVTIYNHYSDTQYNATTGAEEFAFTGAAFGYNKPIAMMETVICDTQDQCTPGKPGNIIPTGGSRKPIQSPLICSPGKFMYMGWEDRPFLAKNPASTDYSSANSLQWTDSDYDDIRLVISCPSPKVVSYKTKVWLIK